MGTGACSWRTSPGKVVPPPHPGTGPGVPALTSAGVPRSPPRLCGCPAYLGLPPSGCAHPGVSGQALWSLPGEGESPPPPMPPPARQQEAAAALQLHKMLERNLGQKKKIGASSLSRGEAHGSRRGAALIHSHEAPRAPQPLPRNQNIHPVSFCGRDPSWPPRTHRCPWAPGCGLRWPRARQNPWGRGVPGSPGYDLCV